MTVITALHPPCRCFRCGYLLTGATGVDGHPPRPGDFSFCIECGTLLAFDADLTLRAPTAEERARMAADPWFARFAAAVDLVRQRRQGAR